MNFSVHHLISAPWLNPPSDFLLYYFRIFRLKKYRNEHTKKVLRLVRDVVSFLQVYVDAHGHRRFLFLSYLHSRCPFLSFMDKL